VSLQGTILGKYRILSRLGEGGMGTVYRARDELLDRNVAIKVLRADLAGQNSLVERFRSEAIALARLGHPRIAMLHGLERDGTQFMMIMEFVAGETLEAIIARSGPIPWRNAAEYCAAVCDALEHAHEQGVVHRDIKPANIMITRGGHIKVMDFGIARVMGRSRQTQLGRSVGTPMYMAPEQLRGEEVDGRADTYALGAVLYEMLTGKLAFDADSDYSLMMKQLNDPPPRPSLCVAGLPVQLDEIVAHAMAKRREDRFTSAGALRSSLQGLLREIPAPSEPELKVTRLAESATATAPVVAPTRLGDDRSSAVPATRLAESPGVAATKRRWASDWRIWSTAAGVLLVATIVVRSGRPPAEPQQPAPAPAPTPATSSPVGAAAPAPPNPPTPDPRLKEARPLPAEPGPGPSRRPPVQSPDPRPEPSPLPAPVPPPVPPSGSGGIGEAVFDRAPITSAVNAWLAIIGSKQADRMAALAPGPKPHSQLLDLVREGRVSLAGQDVPEIEVRDNEALVTVGTNLAYRSPFGATRRSTVRFRLELVRQGNGWRVARAQILGTPRLD
jgi:serine/threonine protein kinase